MVLHGMELIRSQRGLMLWLAPRLGVQASTISGGGRVPAERVHDIERLTGLPRYWLRPDLWAPPWGTEERWFARHAPVALLPLGERSGIG